MLYIRFLAEDEDGVCGVVSMRIPAMGKKISNANDQWPVVSGHDVMRMIYFGVTILHILYCSDGGRGGARYEYII